jgi:hypothetical protein
VERRPVSDPKVTSHDHHHRRSAGLPIDFDRPPSHVSQFKGHGRCARRGQRGHGGIKAISMPAVLTLMEADGIGDNPYSDPEQKPDDEGLRTLRSQYHILTIGLDARPNCG